MANNTTMTYNGQDISPVPLITLARETIQVKNEANPIGWNYRLTLNGTLTPRPDNEGSLSDTDALADGLRNIFDTDGKRLLVMCDANVIMDLCPRVKSITFQEGNNQWVESIPYTVELEYDRDEAGGTPDSGAYVESVSDEWSLEFVQDHKYFAWDLSGVANQEPGQDYAAVDTNNSFEARVTRTLNVVGKQSWVCVGGVQGPTDGVDNAMSYILGTGAAIEPDDYNTASNFGREYGHGVIGITNLTVSQYNIYDHFRTHTINESNGSVNLVESWFIVGENSGLAEKAFTEDFDVSVIRSVTEGRTRMTIQGTIQGLEERTYATLNSPNPVARAAYDAASSAWSTIQNRVFPRAQLIFQNEGLPTRLNPEPASKTVGHGPSKGIITYNYEFDDRPCSFISGSLTEQITVTDNNPADVFAKIAVLGRAAGPVLQSISTFTESTREVTVEAVMRPPTGCDSLDTLNQNHPSGQVENLLCMYETQLTGPFTQVFKNSDVETWSPLTGRYSRSVLWTYADCSGSGVTTLC